MSRSPLGRAIDRLVYRTVAVAAVLCFFALNSRYDLLGGAA